jgi:hypothetical protein
MKILNCVSRWINHIIIIEFYLKSEDKNESLDINMYTIEIVVYPMLQ